MIILGDKIDEAINNGLARQVIVADSEGFVLDNKGHVYDPDELVSVFMSTQRHTEEGVARLDFGQVNEFSFRLVGTDMTIACRRVYWADGGCLVIVVVPLGAAHNLIISDVIRTYGKYVEEQRAALQMS